MENILYYETEALVFEHALPIGNGRLGAMVYGKVSKEKISLNEDTLWTGTGKRNPVAPDPIEACRMARELVLEDKISEAQDIIAEKFNAMWSQMYLPLGNLYFDFGHGDAKNYARNLNFSDGISRVSYEADGVLYEREYFASHPDDVIVLKFRASKQGALSFEVTPEIQLKVLSGNYENGVYTISGVCPSNGCLETNVQKEPIIYTEEKGIGFTLAYKVFCDGEVSGSTECIRVKNATEAVVYVSIKTSYNGFDKNPDKEGLNHYENALNALDGKNLNVYEKIKEAHRIDFSSLYNRVNLNIKSEIKPEGDIASRLKNFDGSDTGLYELLFGYGRYLTISGSRPHTQAMNLQGIWNEDLPPKWNCGYTTNINTQMNYWPTLSTNLAECFEPFVALAKNIHKSGKITAKEYYGARGFVCHHNTDLWAMTNPVGYKKTGWSCLYSFWNMGSGWVCCQLYDLYEYTLDKSALADIYPIMRDAVLFYTDILYKDEKGYTICPSTSPENTYTRGDATDLSLSKTTTMTICILRELFERYLKASEILGISDELTKNVSEIYPELYPIPIGSDGRLMEWAYEEIETEITHRHVAHLYSLYPGNHISVRKTPELAEACKKSLIVRTDEGSGWSLGWKISFWAFLKDGNHALEVLKQQLRLVQPSGKISYAGGGGVYSNLFDAHPPFQIDGNFAATAAICNMLVQSEIGYIELLPALPDLWKDGSVSGIIAKGNVEVCMEWKEGKVTKLSLKSPYAGNIDVCFNGKTKKISLESGVEYKVM